MAQTKSIAVIDGNSLMHRAYHAVPPTMNAPDGTPTNAVFGFLSMFVKFYELYKPDAIVCAFDAGKPEHRIKAMEQYKAQRPHMDDELRCQFPLIEDLLQAMNVPVVKVPGWEGDDILGTIAKRDEALGFKTLLVTGDKDANQLATELTHILTTKRGITDVIEFDPATVFEKYGVTPDQFPDFLGLMGDSSDNIPGVPGIGPKTATKLLQKYGSLDALYEHTDELKGKQKENVENNKEAAYLSREVATIVTDLDFDCDLEGAAFPAFEAERVDEAFRKLQMTMHLHKILALADPSATSTNSLPIKLEPVFSFLDDPAKAKALLKDAATTKDLVGISVSEPMQQSLFGPERSFAFALSQGIVYAEGAEGLSLLVSVLGTCHFSTMSLHELLSIAFPPGSPSVDENDVPALDLAKCFDLGLVGYVLDASKAPWALDAIAEEFAQTSIVRPDNVPACVVDAAAVRALKPLLEKQLEERGGEFGVYNDIDLPLVPVLAQMERTGAALDTLTLKELGKTTQSDLETLSEKIFELAGEEFNIDSPKQLAHILFEVLCLPPKKKTTRGYSTDASVLKDLAAEGAEICEHVIHYRELAKLKGTYIDALPRMLAEDGRIHTSFNETVTATGRLSSSDPNLQNIPVRTEFGRRIRACFVPLEPEHVFLGADYSQIELRLLAHLSGDERLIEAFKSGEDFHAETAAAVFGLPLDQVTPDIRRRAKAVNFGIVYGQQAFGLSQSLGIPFGEAKDMIDRYFATYPKVRAYLDSVVADARKTGYAETMFGRRRNIPELHARNRAQQSFGERTAMNHPMQGSAADLIKLAMVQVQERLERENLHAKMMLQVHDELDFSVPASEVENLTALVKDVMEHVAELRVPLEVEVTYGKTWAEAH